MAQISIYHNPRCSKSREALGALQEMNKDFQLIDYLKNPPTEKELTDILKKLGIEPEALVRKGEAVYKEKYKGKTLSKQEWIEAMVENPILIERPVVVVGNKAVIGRPVERIKDLLV